MTRKESKKDSEEDSRIDKIHESFIVYVPFLFFAILILIIPTYTLASRMLASGLFGSGNIANNITMTGVIMSSFLTAILVAIYWNVANSIKKQAEIIEEQKETDYKPQLVVRSIQIREGEKTDAAGKISGSERYPDPTEPFREDRIKIKIANLWEGVAVNLKIDMSIEPIDSNIGEYKSKTKPLKLPNATEVLQAGKRGIPLPEHYANYLEKGTTKTFEVDLVFDDIYDNEVKEVPFSAIMYLLRHQDVNKVHVKMAIIYEDVTGEEHNLNLIDFESNIEDYSTLEKAVKQELSEDE